MKYLENIDLENLSYYLTGHEIGGKVLKGRIECFSCKRAGEDKKLSKSLDQKYAEDYTNEETSSSSLGNMSRISTRKLLIDLLQTMNASFVDHDFSDVSPESFRPVSDVDTIISKINSYLNEITSTRPQFIIDLWKAINEVMQTQECDVYTYVPDLNDDPMSEGAIWTFNYFFVSKELKRICYFTCFATPKGLLSINNRKEYGCSDNDYDDSDNVEGGLSNDEYGGSVEDYKDYEVEDGDRDDHDAFDSDVNTSISSPVIDDRHHCSDDEV